MLVWYENNQKNRITYNANYNYITIPATVLDETKAINKVIKVKLGIDREKKRIIIKYTDNNFRGFNLTKTNNKRDITYKLSTHSFPEINKILQQGQYDVFVKENEIEIDVSHCYKKSNKKENPHYED